MKLSMDSRLRALYTHPLGRDVIDKILLQLGKPVWLVDNPLVGSLKLRQLKALLGERVGPGFFDTVLTLLNSEPDAPRTDRVTPQPAWWKEAVFYQIYPRSFSEDGLRGILSRLDDLQALGVDAVWLSPVYDSPNDDNGYDIRDYYAILPEFGTMADMDALIEGLHARKMKLVMDLVVNHTSDEHFWFQEALHDDRSPYRAYYFFREAGEQPPNNWTSFFSGSAWKHYAEQDVWALHLFSQKQMDLNWECAELRAEIHAMARWWLERGVDGFRLDVINYISKADGLPDGDGFVGSLMGYRGIEHYFYGPRLHEYLRGLREEAFVPYDAFAVGETPGIGAQCGRLLTDSYRGELDLIFPFDHLETPGHARFDEYQYDLTYLKQFYISHLNADRGHGWNALFFNNHDNPRMVSKIDPSGEHAEAVAKLLAVLLFTLRGTPFIYQGDEAGMRNAHFSSIDELRDVESLNLYAELVQTMPPDAALRRVLAGTRDHARVSLPWDVFARQREDPRSVWRFYQSLIALRRASKPLVYGELTFLQPNDRHLFRYTRRLGDDCFFIELNLTPHARKRGGAAVRSGPDTTLLLCSHDGEPDTLRPYESRVYRTR